MTTKETGEPRALAAEFIEVNARRRELEEREKALREELLAFFVESGLAEIATERGSVVCSPVVKTNYDLEKLKTAVPASAWELITRPVVNEKLLSALLEQGAVDSRVIDGASSKEISYRLTIRAGGGGR